MTLAPDAPVTAGAPADDRAAALAARYGVPVGEVDAVAPGAVGGTLAGPVVAAQLAHRSVRRYLPDPLDPDVVPALVAAAQSAPSSSNLQLWSVVAVTDPGRRARLAALAGDQEHIRTAPLLLVWVADLHRVRGLADRHGVVLEATDYLETTVVGVVDAVIAAQNAVVAAEARGLGTVYIGALRNHPEEVAAELGLPAGVVAVVGLVVGHPDPAGGERVKPRLPQAAVLHHERYAPVDAALVDDYERRIEPFYRDEQLGGGWTERVLDRLRVPASLRGRAHLRTALARRGFPSN